MPKLPNGTFQGIWGVYEGAQQDAKYPEDEEAVSEAADSMFSLCGNAGQETLIGDQLDNFEEWANGILENESDNVGTTFEDFAEMVTEDWYEGREDKFAGTRVIWSVGWAKIAKQSGYHDAHDEAGEGMGQEFHS